MDQSKTALPYFTEERIKPTPICGHCVPILQGRSPTAQYLLTRVHISSLNTADIPSDSNLTLNVLMYTLESYVHSFKKLPEVLYLQFDNCWRENKNQYVLMFACLLVEMGIVKKVRHKHEVRHMHKVSRKTMNLPTTTASPKPKKRRLSDDFSNSDENMKRLAAAMDRRFDELEQNVKSKLKEFTLRSTKCSSDGKNTRIYDE